MPWKVHQMNYMALIGVKSDHRLRPQEFFEEGLPLAGILVLHRHRQRLPPSHKHHQLLAPSNPGVDQVALQKHVGKGA